MLTERLLRRVLKDDKMPKGKVTPAHSLCHSSQAGLLGGKRFFVRAAPEDFPGGPVVKDPPPKAGDTGSIPGPGRCHRPESS